LHEELEREPPASLDAIAAETARLGFDMASEPGTGALLRVLAASRPGGRMLVVRQGSK
jgi:predicted O-methyltransferase YrrM